VKYGDYAEGAENAEAAEEDIKIRIERERCLQKLVALNIFLECRFTSLRVRSAGKFTVSFRNG
jgi:hypothetical protein